MTVETYPNFTDQAVQRWQSIPSDIRRFLITHVRCSSCRKEVTITNFSGVVRLGKLLLVGQCAECRSHIAREIEPH